MQRRRFGPMTDEVPIIGQGTWKMDGDVRTECVRAIQRGLDLGMTHIDTAELYGYGAAERIVGEAIAARRKDVFLVSKVMPRNASRRGIREACERSLRHLGTDYLDVYLLHWPGDEPLAETMAGFSDLVRAGKIRAFGVSNFDADEIEEAVRLAGPGKIACNQVLYHPAERAIEHRVLPACVRHGIAVVAYTPFGQTDFFSTRKERGQVLAEIARAHGATPRQVVLAFVTRDPHVLTIPKASRLAHVEENAGAGDLVLGAEEISRIEAAFPLGRDRGGVPSL